MKKKVLICLTLIFILGVSNAFSGGLTTKEKPYKVWTGFEGPEWFNPNNWNPIGVPDATDNVYIPDGTISPVLNIINDTIVTVCKGLEIDNGVSKAGNGGFIIEGGEIVIDGNLSVTNKGSMYIYPDGALTVNGTTKIDDARGGIFQIESGGSLITNGAISGNAIVKRNIPNDLLYHFLSCPVTSHLICNGVFAPTLPNFPTTSPLSYDFYTFDPACTPPNHWINLRTTSNTPNTAAFGSPPAFNVLAGYLVSYNPNYDTSKVFIGNPNTGDKVYSLATGADGCTWNLLGNPYPSAVNWDIVPDKGINLSSGYYYVWNEHKVGGPGYEAYLDGTQKSTGINGNIPSMQGFFVKASPSGNKSLDVPNSCRVHDNATDKWLKSKIEETPVNKIIITLGNDTNFDETYVLFAEGRSTGKDWYDAEKLVSLDVTMPQIYSLIDNDQKTMFNSMPYTSSPVTIPIGVVTPSTGNYSITVSGTESFSSLSGLTLEDLKTNQSQNMMITPVYTFDASSPEDAGRFLLHLTGTIGINDPKDDNSVRIFASQHTIFVTSTTDLQNATVSVYNLLGQNILTKQLQNQKQNKVVLNAPDGYYVVKVMSQGMIKIAKVNIGE